jgi:hypothetical protein
MSIMFGRLPLEGLSAAKAIVPPISAAADIKSPTVPKKDRLDTLFLITPPFCSSETAANTHKHA